MRVSFRINCGMRKGYIKNVYMDSVMKEMKMRMVKMGVIFLGKGRSGDYQVSCFMW